MVKENNKDGTQSYKWPAKSQQVICFHEKGHNAIMNYVQKLKLIVSQQTMMILIDSIPQQYFLTIISGH